MFSLFTESVQIHPSTPTATTKEKVEYLSISCRIFVLSNMTGYEYP
jgi:mannose-6-phosphate isomerase class I